MRFHGFGRHLIRVACFILFAWMLLHAQGTTNNFTNGSSDDTWENPANWSLGHVPLSTEDVTIGGSLIAVISSSSVQSIRSLTMTGTSSLMLDGLELDIAQPSSVALGSTITVRGVGGCPPPGATLVLASTSTLTVSGTMTVEISCAVLRGAGTVNIKGGGHFNWIGGNPMNTPPTLGGDPGGTLNLAPMAFFDISVVSATGVNHALSTYTINNNGTVTWADGAKIQAGNGAVFNNLDGGGSSKVIVHGTTTFDNSLGGAAPQFNNSGTFDCSGCTTTTFTGVPFTNTVTNGIPGTVAVGTNGNLVFGAGYTQTAGGPTFPTITSIGSSGSISVGAAGFNLKGGTLTSSTGGTITGNVINNGGHVQPGGGSPFPGTLTITGNYTQGASGILDLGLAGTTAGKFSVLAISGTATLGGTLNALSASGFTPPANGSFQVMTFASRTGDFTTNNLTVNGVALTKIFHPGDLTLVVKHRPGQLTSQ